MITCLKIVVDNVSGTRYNFVSKKWYSKNGEVKKRPCKIYTG